MLKPFGFEPLPKGWAQRTLDERDHARDELAKMDVRARGLQQGLYADTEASRLLQNGSWKSSEAAPDEKCRMLAMVEVPGNGLSGRAHRIPCCRTGPHEEHLFKNGTYAENQNYQRPSRVKVELRLLAKA